MSPRAQVAVLVVAAILAGAGVGALVVTLTGSAGERTTTKVLTTTVSPSSGGGAGTVTTAPPAPNPPVAEALAEVKAKGYAVADTGTYDSAQRLSVLIGVLKGSADSTAQKAFFFADGRLIGTDTADVSANVQVATQSADEIGLRYALYKRRDPQCCPTDGAVIVDYNWDGSSLKPLQAIPPSSISADGSRR